MKKVETPKPKIIFSVRLDPDKINKLQSLKIDIADLLRNAVDAELNKHTHRCPTCGEKK